MITQVSLKINLLTYFLTIVTLVAAMLIGVQYHFNMKLANAAAEQSFQQVADKLSLFINERDNRLIILTDLVAHDNSLSQLPAVGELHKNIGTFVELLDQHPDIYAIYIGLDDGRFYEIIQMQSVAGLYQTFGVAPSVRWAMIQIIGEGQERKKHWTFLDDQLQTVAQRVEPDTYDPRVRPWFNRASKSQSVVKTEPYQFSFIDASGITYAKQLVTANGVLGIDLTLDSLNQFLASQQTGDDSEIFLYDRDGEKYASSSPLDLVDQNLQRIDVEVSPVRLTDEELLYIKNHPTLRVSNELDWPPLDFAIKGRPMGYSIDYLKLLSRKTGLGFQFINGYNWNELLQLFRQGKLDLIHSAYQNADREAFALFSDPMLEIKNLLIARSGIQVNGIEDLYGKTLALPAGWATIAFIRQHYPQINVVEVPQILTAYRMVNEGTADATVDHQLSLQYMQTKYALNNLRAGPWFKEFDRQQTQQLFMMVQKDQHLLVSILNKAIASLTEQELETLQRKWDELLCHASQKNCKGDNVIRRNMVPSVFMQMSANTPSGLMRYEDGEATIFAYSAPLQSQIASQHRLGLIRNASSFLKPYLDTVTVSLVMGVVVLVLAIPIVLYATQQILKPIRALMIENSKISQRSYHEVRKVKTHIKELSSLSQSLIDLSKSIRAYEKAQEQLLDSFIQLIADAIDAKSPYTGGHCARVPELGMMLVRAANDQQNGPFKDFSLQTDDEWREFRTGAWLHDCGKVTTPEYVVDKATKLETLYNRIHEVRTRFEVLWRDAEIISLQRQLRGENAETVSAWLMEEQQRLIEEFNFIAECNIGGEFMSAEKQSRVRQIAQRKWMRHFDNRIGVSQGELLRFANVEPGPIPIEEPLLDDRPEHVVARVHFDEQAYVQQGFKMDVPDDLYNYGELYNLCIEKGTLTPEERFKINEHIVMTIRMLEQLPLPEYMQRIPEYAGTHHETMDGRGYPRRLNRDELSIPARVMALADVFEALTATDRPYKPGKPLSESIKILGLMCQDEHIDRDVFRLFLESGVYLQYAEIFLKPEQIDAVDIEDYLTLVI